MNGELFEGFPVYMPRLFLVGLIAGVENGEGDFFIHEDWHSVVPCRHIGAFEGYTYGFRGEWLIVLCGV